MITVRKRVIAMLCCITLLVTGLYVAEPAQAQAAESEVSITQAKAVFDLAENARFLNLDISTIADYKSGWPGFITSTNTDFVKEHITFGGGMTYDDFMNGIDRTYVATESIVQFNWKNRTELFQPGWSFTIAQGAPMTYTTNSGATAIAKLDKEYTITFGKGTDTNKNSVEVTSVKKTTFSLAAKNYWGNSSSGSTEFWFDAEDTTVNNFNDKYYKSIVDNQEYEEYVQLGNMNYSELNNDVKLRYVLDGNSRCLQMEDWGTLRNTMKSGDQIIFYKGLPIYYTDTAGTNWRATLDATYVYECRKTNIDGHTQTFNSIKLDDTIGGFGFQSASRSGTWYEEKHDAIVTNFNLQACANDTVKTYTDIMKEKIAEQYIEIAGYTVAQARDLGVEIKYIVDGNSKCLQVRFSGEAKSLPAGTTILLKKGMPIAYGEDADVNKFYTGILDDDYRIVIDETDGSMMRISCHLYGEYNLKEMDLSQRSEGGANNDKYHYWGMPTQDEAFVDVNSRTELRLSKEVMSEYLYLSGHDVTSLYNENDEQAVYLKVYSYLQTIFQGIRFFDKGITYNNGEVMILRKGLPISYTTTDGRTKVITLDKDYGYVYDAETQGFRYDANLTYEDTLIKDVSFTFTKANGTAKQGDGYIQNLEITTVPTINAEEQYVNVLDQDEACKYIDFFGLSIEDLSTYGAKLLFIPHVNVLQIQWGSSLEWVNQGAELVFKQGMPIAYKLDSKDATVVLANDTVFKVTAVDYTNHLVTLNRFAPSGTFALEEKTLGTGNSSVENPNTLIALKNSETGEKDVLSDAKSTFYYQIPSDIVERYIDFFKWTSEEIADAKVVFKIINDGGLQVFQILWGTSAGKMVDGSLMTLKKGMPFNYTTSDGRQKEMYLDKDYVYQVRNGDSNNTKYLDYVTSSVGGTWGLKSSAVINVAGTVDGPEGYYNNIAMSECTLKDNVTSMNLNIDSATLSKYMQFGTISGADYATLNIKVLLIITDRDQCIQLRWGNATEHVKDGDKIVFKKGMPVVGTKADGKKAVYNLDANYTFTIRKSDSSANGFSIAGIKDMSESVTGDMDSDYLLNKNDIELLRMYLVGAVTLRDEKTADVTGDETPCGSRDLVRAKKEWDQVEPEEYETLYINSAIPQTLTTSGAEATVTIQVDKDLGTRNYIRLTYQTDQNLVGKFVYADDSDEYTEDFYLDASELQFEQFLDNYRTNGLNITNKTLKRVELTNVGSEIAHVRVNKVEISNRDMQDDQMIYMDNGSVKLGVDLNMGGSIGFLSSLSYSPVEVKDASNREIRIETNYQETANVTNLSNGKEVNLVNIYDLGRQIQQSYYIDVKDSSYTHGEYDDKSNWPYNPVQAGDKNNNESQIIDYRIVETETHSLIYVKTRAMDWGQNTAKTTKSYMENWYKLNGNMIQVENTFVNWEGFNNPGDMKSQELPAMYPVQTLNYFVEGNDPTKRTVYGPWSGKEGFKVEGTGKTSNWYAWVNDETDTKAFGLGIYIPGVQGCNAGRMEKTRKYQTQLIGLIPLDVRKNVNAESAPMLTKHSYLKNLLYNNKYQSSFVENTSYVAPFHSTILKDYRSYAYTYVLSVDTLDNMSNNFEKLEESQLGLNQFEAWNN